MCAPGDSFSTDFVTKPDIHTFPVLNISKSSSLRVSVASLPRQKYIPAINCLKEDHRALKKAPPPASSEYQAPLYQHVSSSDMYPQVEQSLTRRQRSIEDLKLEFQQRNPTWRQKHSSGEDTSTSSSSEEDQAEKIRQKKAACAPKLEVVLPEVYKQQGAVPKSRTPPKWEQQPTLEEPAVEDDKSKLLRESNWCLPPGTPASLYKSEHQISPPPEVHRQLFSMPIPAKKSSRNDFEEAKITRLDHIASAPQIGHISSSPDAFNSQVNKTQFCDRLSSFTSCFNRDSLVPNYYDTTSMQSINQQLSSLSLVQCSTDTGLDTSTDDNDDVEEGAVKDEDDDLDWQWNIDDRIPRQRTSSERTLSTEEEDNGITFCAKSTDDFNDGDDTIGGEEFWDTSSSWTDDDVIVGSQLENYSEISDDDSFVSCLSGSYSSSPCLSSFTPRQQIEAQLRQHFKHRDDTTPSLTRPSSSPNSPSKVTKLSTNRSSPKHDKPASPARTTSKFVSSSPSTKDSPTTSHMPSPTSSPRHNRTRGLSLDSHDFKADIPAPFHRPAPTDGGPPACGSSPFAPVFSKSKSLLRSVIGKENVPQAKEVSCWVGLVDGIVIIYSC